MGPDPAVPVPFRGRELAEDALRAYAAWMAEHQVAGVAVWAHTGRGPHLSPDQRRRVLAAWRTALPMSQIVAGATSVEMAAEAKAGGANALLAFPQAADPVGYHRALGRELPVSRSISTRLAVASRTTTRPCTPSSRCPT